MEKVERNEWDGEEIIYALEEENEDLKLELFRLKTRGMDGTPLAKALHEFLEWHSAPREDWSREGFNSVSRTLWEAVDESAHKILRHHLHKPDCLEASYGKDES